MSAKKAPVAKGGWGAEKKARVFGPARGLKQPLPDRFVRRKRRRDFYQAFPGNAISVSTSMAAAYSLSSSRVMPSPSTVTRKR